MKTNELIGAALDWAVAKCEPDSTLEIYFDNETGEPLCHDDWSDNQEFRPSTDWAQGGPIIEREGIAVDCQRCNGKVDGWVACNEIADGRDDNWDANVHHGPTPLIAAMRCYVASKLGDDVTLPPELEATL